MGVEPIKIQENLYYLGVNDRQTEFLKICGRCLME